MKLTERGKERGGLPRRSRLEREWGARGICDDSGEGGARGG